MGFFIFLGIAAMCAEFVFIAKLTGKKKRGENAKHEHFAMVVACAICLASFFGAANLPNSVPTEIVNTSPYSDSDVASANVPYESNVSPNSSTYAPVETKKPDTPESTESTAPPVSSPSPSLSDAGASTEPTASTSDYEGIRDAFSLIADEYGTDGIVSINPRTIEGEVFSWQIVDVVVPDGWYALENYQKERYCETIGGLVKTALISGGVAKNEEGCAVHFFDIKGAEVAQSKTFGGYKIIK